MAVEHEHGQPRRPAAGRHRKAVPLTVAGQLRGLTAGRHGTATAVTRHRAAGRRIVPKAGGPLGMALATLEEISDLAWLPVRVGSADAAAPTSLPDVQFDIGDFVSPAQTIDGLEVQFHPVHSVFVTAKLARCPNPDDQRALDDALDAIEAHYPFRPDGVFTYVGYGLPYFRRLPGGMSGPLVFRHLPRLRDDVNRFVLEEAEPGPAAGAAAVESNDLLFTFRSDKAGNIRDVIDWLRGSNMLAARQIASPRLSHLLTFTSSRAMFVQVGLPRKLANAHGLSYAGMVDFRSPTWAPVDEPARESAADAVTFCGGGASQLTTADAGDYFDNGSIQRLSHAILGMAEFYWPDRSAPQEPVPVPHIPLEGSGFDNLDIPEGEKAPKLHSGGFYPTAQLAADAAAESRTDGQQRLTTVTRQQNFLVPPRRHRAFPLSELL